MLRLAQEREQLTVINDQFGAPTGGAAAQALAGIYHLVAGGCTTWFEYAQHVIAQAQQLQPTRQIKARELRPVQATFGLTLPEWQLGVNRMLAEIL